MSPSETIAATIIAGANEDAIYRNVEWPGKPKPTDAGLAAFAADTLAGKAVPPREWHVDDLVPARTVTLLNGDGGTGKSLLALQLATATTQGGYWAGRQVKQGRAVYLSAEDDVDELHRRLADIAASSDISLADLADLTIAPMAGKDALLATPDGKGNVLKATKLFAALDALLHATEPALYVIDTLADVFGGEETNVRRLASLSGCFAGFASSTTPRRCYWRTRPLPAWQAAQVRRALPPGTTACAAGSTWSG